MWVWESNASKSLSTHWTLLDMILNQLSETQCSYYCKMFKKNMSLSAFIVCQVVERHENIY